MSDSSDRTLSSFFVSIRRSPELQIEDVFGEYYPRLLGLAKKSLAGANLRMSDADDVVQSVFRTFWQRADAGGGLSQETTGSLWNLLAVITVRKARRHVRHERAQKRGEGRVTDEQGLPGNDQGQLQLAEAAMHCDSPTLDASIEELIGGLDEELRVFAILKLMQYTDAEAADIMECTERTVRRKVQLIRRSWKDDDES